MRTNIAISLHANRPLVRSGDDETQIASEALRFAIDLKDVNLWERLVKDGASLGRGFSACKGRIHAKYRTPLTEISNLLINEESQLGARSSAL